jgi:integrase
VVIREIRGKRATKLILDGRLADGTRLREKVAVYDPHDPESKRQAWVKARDTKRTWEQEIAAGIFSPPATARKAAPATPPAVEMTFAAYVAAFTERSPHRKPDHAARLAQFVALWGPRPLRSITPADLRIWLGERTRAAKVTTAKKDLSALSVLFWDAVEDGIIEANPARAIRKPKNDTEHGVPYRDDEMTALLAAVEPGVRRILLGFKLTGARSKELRELRWSDYDSKNALLKVTRFKTHAVTEYPVAAELKALLDDCAAQPVRSLYIFADDAGKPWASKPRGLWLTQKVRGILKDLKITRDGIEPLHSFRHAFGYAAARAGVPLERLQFLMGHTTPQMTSYYFKLTGDDCREAARILGHSLGTNAVPAASPKGR